MSNIETSEDVIKAARERLESGQILFRKQSVGRIVSYAETYKAERDAYQFQLAQARAALSKAEADRDAYKAVILKHAKHIEVLSTALHLAKAHIDQDYSPKTYETIEAALFWPVS
jgi:chromosome segregation ATPase